MFICFAQQGQKDVKEIVEEYDAEKERLWDGIYVHKWSLIMS